MPLLIMKYIYMKKPEGLKSFPRTETGYRLTKSLCGLKRSGRTWNEVQINV